MADSLAQQRITAYEFTVSLLAALSRRGFVAFWAPRSDSTHATDYSAAAAWQHIEKTLADQFDFRFRLYTHRIYRHSDDWQQALGECEYHGLLTLLSPAAARSDKWWYRLEHDELQHLAAALPGSSELWDTLADIFVSTIEKEAPFALAGTPLSY